MNSLSLRLQGVVSELPRQSAPPELDHICRELREVLGENDRLIERNKQLQLRLKTALDQVSELQHGITPRRPGVPESAPAMLTLGRLRLNYALRRLELDGRSCHLTLRYEQLIGYLMGRPDRLIQTRELAEVLELPPGGNAVRQLIYRVRRRLDEIGARAYLRAYANTWSGGGYWMTDPECALNGNTS